MIANSSPLKGQEAMRKRLLKLLFKAMKQRYTRSLSEMCHPCSRKKKRMKVSVPESAMLCLRLSKLSSFMKKSNAKNDFGCDFKGSWVDLSS